MVAAMAVTPLPLFHDLRGATVLVLGEGAAAERKAALARACGAAIRARTAFSPDDLDGCALAFAAGAEECHLRALAAAARARGIPVNVVDRPELCTALSPATVARPPLLVAISSGGTAPVLARRLRARLEALLPPELGRLAEWLDTLKPVLRSRFPDPAPRRRAIEALLDGPEAALALAGDAAAATTAAMARLDQAAPADGLVHLVAVGPAVPDLLTLRAQRVMGEADLVLHPPDMPPAVLDLARRDASFLADAAPLARMVAGARDGGVVVRLARGAQPAEFGPERRALAASGIAVFVVPGAADLSPG
jgi:uroporphyrin-III C-methyltransferase/precorrin-2 dehydrogenase/sirohydrochlorin ferrochelatase